MTAALERSESGSYVLRFRLSNTLQAPVSLNESSLPWAWPYACSITAVRIGYGVAHVLARAYPVADPPFGTVTIPAGQILEGSIALNRFLPGIHEAVLKKKGDVLIFWIAEPRTSTDSEVTDFQVVGRFAGWVELPGGDSGAIDLLDAAGDTEGRAE
jgi:hypothetical protein